MIDTEELEAIFKEQFPSHTDIEKRAYELYLERVQEERTRRGKLAGCRRRIEKEERGGSSFPSPWLNSGLNSAH